MKATTDMFFSIHEWEKPLHINFLFSYKKMHVTVTSQSIRKVDNMAEPITEFKNLVSPRVSELVVNSEKSWVVFEIQATDEAS